MFIRIYIGAFLVVFSLFIVPSGHAISISLTEMESPYSQNFSTLAKTGTSSSLLPAGWAMSTASYLIGSGVNTAPGMRSYGPVNLVDRALGSLSGSVDLFYGASFTNKTGSTINSLDIAYTGEQWRRGNNANPDTLYFQYSLDATSLTAPLATWIDVSALNFVSPKTGASTGIALDGNVNSSSIQFEILSLAIADGASFWIRFKDVNIPGDEHGLAVDNFFLTSYARPVPEPSTLLLLGAGLLGLAGLSRRGGKR